MPPDPTSARDAVRAVFAADLAALAFDLAPERLASPSRDDPQAVLVRRIAFYLAHVGWGLNVGRTAAAFGCDRSTVSKACRVVEDLRDQPAFDAVLDRLETCLRQAPAEPVVLPAGAMT